MSTTTEIPQRFTEAAFRRYEGIIAQAVAVLPSRYHFEPRSLGLSLETATARLRDAMRSLHIYRWTTGVNMTAFDRYWPSLLVRQEPPYITIDLRRHGEPLPARETPSASLEVSCPNEEVVRGLAILLAQRILPSAVLTGVTREFVERIVIDMDIAIIEKDGKVVLL